MPQSESPLSLHDLDIPQTLEMAKMLNCAPDKVLCLGVVPERITPGTELSPALSPLVPKIAQLVLEAVATFW